MSPIEVLPIDRSRRKDLEKFSQGHGTFRYCSCMKWRMRSTDFKNSSKEDRCAALEKLVLDGEPVGVLAYVDGEPVGWCSMAPRTDYAGLERYRALPRVDDVAVWSVVCFYADRSVRGGSGVQQAMLRGAVDHARDLGAAAVEGYPADPEAKLYRYMGSVEVFRAAGFTDVTPAGQQRRVMRYPLG
jgi:hypothetical protein